MAMAATAQRSAVACAAPNRPTPRPPFPPRAKPAIAATAALSLCVATGQLVAAAPQAVALSKDDLVSTLTKVDKTVGQVTNAGSKVLDFSFSAVKVLSEALKPGIDTAAPVVRSAGEEALKIASPFISDASKQVQDALENAGIDPTLVSSAAKTATDVAQQTSKVIEGVKPIASATVETIATSDPSVVVVSAGTVVILYFLLPPVWSVASFLFRGYKGDLSAAQSLDLLVAQNYLLVDIRPDKEKSKSGVPQLPGNARSQIISVPIEDLPNKLKGIVRDARKVEAEIAALKISYLKRLNKGSNIIIMDSYCDVAKKVAKTLTSLGHKNSWVMTGGFSGGKGWAQSRLGTDSYNSPLVEVLSPSRVIPASATSARFGTGSTANQPSRKLLPGKVDG